MVGYIAVSCLIAGAFFGYMICAIFSVKKHDEQQAEIGRLHKEIKSLEKHLETARALPHKAVKEFAAELHKRVADVGVHSAIDCVVKEMVGDEVG